MKIQTLTKEARDICIKARARQKDHFHNDSFVDDYLAFCKATNFEDTSAENFMFIPSIEIDNSNLRVEMVEGCTPTIE